MSDSTSRPNLTRKSAALIGLAIVFVIALLVNFIVQKFALRADLTENNAYTLSEGTKNILSSLETPVSIRYFVTDSADVMSPAERARTQRFEDLLNEYVRHAPSRVLNLPNEEGEFEAQNVKMLTVEKLNPEPDTDAEDAALLAGLQRGQSPETLNEIFFGLTAKSLLNEETMPFIAAIQETSLEYELSQMISSVHSTEKKLLTVMTSMEVAGGFSGNFQAPPKQPWFFLQQLQENYQVETIPATATQIPAETSALIVIHPYDITPEAQFAIDQYLLAGGDVLIMVDPNFFYSRALGGGQPQMPGAPPQSNVPPTSDLDTLFAAWGVKYDANQVLADTSYATEILQRGNFSPTFLTLNAEAVSSAGQDSMITSKMTQLNALTPGAFEFEEKEGIAVATLIESSKANQLVDPFDADPTTEGGVDRLREKFTPHGEPRALVAQLTGTFTTAFPDGDPAAAQETEEAPKEGDQSDEPEKTEETEEPAALTESKEPGRVLLFSDVDFIYDTNVVRIQEIQGFGIRIPQILNQNTELFANAVDMLSGDVNLMQIRSRQSVRRPFIKQNEWKMETEAKFQVELAKFEQEMKATEAELQGIMANTPGDINEAMLSPEVQQKVMELREKEITTGKRIREIQKASAKEFRQKISIYKLGNTLIIPAVLIIFGVFFAISRRRSTAAR